jgi:hypothetical protein
MTSKPTVLEVGPASKLRWIGRFLLTANTPSSPSPSRATAPDSSSQNASAASSSDSSAERSTTQSTASLR